MLETTFITECQMKGFWKFSDTRKWKSKIVYSIQCGKQFGAFQICSPFRGRHQGIGESEQRGGGLG